MRKKERFVWKTHLRYVEHAVAFVSLKMNHKFKNICQKSFVSFNAKSRWHCRATNDMQTKNSCIWCCSKHAHTHPQRKEKSFAWRKRRRWHRWCCVVCMTQVLRAKAQSSKALKLVCARRRRINNSCCYYFTTEWKLFNFNDSIFSPVQSHFLIRFPATANANSLNGVLFFYFWHIRTVVTFNRIEYLHQFIIPSYPKIHKNTFGVSGFWNCLIK